MVNHNPDHDPSISRVVHRILFGVPKQLKDPSLFQKLSLIPLLAWVGLGADGLSSSAYGPEEAFRALGDHGYLALLLAVATGTTVFIISYAYSRIIEHFPFGGGGYVVASRMLGRTPGLISGSALLVDYVLTITVSIAACADAVFSYLPQQLHAFKVPFACFLLMVLIVLNIRGVKESITVLTPVFTVFIITHGMMLFDGLVTHTDRFAPLANDFRTGIQRDFATLGVFGTLAIFLRAYSLGGGTYTGIEAVSNGLQIMREPSVHSGKRTMLYMASSLAFTAGTLFLCYALLGIKPVSGRTLNAVLAGELFADWPLGGWVAFVTIFSEGALLFVAAQTGFVDGPRVMSNMAIDSWFPRRFAALSERLTMQNGIVLMGAAAIAVMLYTGGSVSALVVMYSINVFITFFLSQLGMSLFYVRRRHVERERWKRHLSVHLMGLFLCGMILAVTIAEKFTEGGWLTLMITAGVLGCCFLIRGHYTKVGRAVARLDEIILNAPTRAAATKAAVTPMQQTAIQLVGGYNGLGVHTLLSILANFPHLYQNILFVSVAVIDSGSFKGIAAVESLENKVKSDLARYVDLAGRLGVAADFRMAVATDVVESAVEICKGLRAEFPKSTFFAGKLVFEKEQFYYRLLHNETAFAVQRHLLWSGIPMVVLPIRVKM
jgi:amino acid transporter